MNIRPITMVGSLLIATMTVAPALADEQHAPPMLTPSAAADIALACPEAGNAATALVKGVTLVQANAALPLLTRCATQVRFADLRWKNMYAAVGVAAAQLSQAILTNDSALFKRVADFTMEARAVSHASDAAIRSWTDIPDVFDASKQTALSYPDHCGASLVSNVAYLNVVARTGSAWITTPRATPTSCRGYVPYAPPGSLGTTFVIFPRPPNAPDEMPLGGGSQSGVFTNPN